MTVEKMKPCEITPHLKKIIEICNNSIETDQAEGYLHEPIGRSDTFMIRNTLQSLIPKIKALTTEQNRRAK